MRVLVPLDGSKATYDALDRGLRLLASASPGITLLNVRHEGFDNPIDPAYVEETFEKDDEDEVFPSEASSLRALERGAEIVRRHGFTPATLSVVGRPLEKILEEARNHDVLLLHALGPSSLRDTLRGSGSEHLVRKSPCSVLLVR